jgi:PAS domain S-box-containing protein
VLQAIPAPEIHGTALRPPEVERAYRDRYLREDARVAAAFVAMVTLGFLLLGVGDFRFAVTQRGLAAVLSARAAIVGFGIAAIWSILVARRPAVLDGWVILWSVAYALRVVLQAIRPADHFLPLLSDVAISMSLWLMFPARFSCQVVAAGFVAAGTFTWLVAFREPPPYDGWVLIATVWITANGIAAYVSWRLHRQRRATYLDLLRLAAAEKGALEREATLAAREQRQRNLLDNLQAGVVVHAPDTSILQSNRMAAILLGLSTDQMRGKVAVDPGWRFVREDGTTLPVQEYPVARVLATKAPVVEQVLGIDRPTTQDRAWVLVNAYPEFDESRDVQQVVVTFVGITGRKMAEELLRTSEERHRLLAENARDVVWTMSVDGKITYVSPSVEKMRGFTAAEAMLQTIEEIHPPASRAISLGYFTRLYGRIQAGLPPESFRGELEYRCKDGSTIWTEVIVLPVVGPDGAVREILGVARDLSERRRAEAELRLAAMGTLVAGVGHEINNPLTAALSSDGFAIDEVEQVRDLLRSGGPVDREELARQLDEVREALGDAQASGGRIARIVKDMTLSGRPDAGRTRVRMGDVVEHAMRWLPRTVGENVTVRIMEGKAPDVVASPVQLAQVVANLVTNAIRSIPPDRRGVVTVSTGPGSPGMARVEVADDGSGMTPAMLERIFEPFFTTRPVGEGRGTGLGLTVCRAIVTAHGGTIAATSEVGKGSTFRVEFPAAPAKA